jgi:hypothetical protein
MQKSAKAIATFDDNTVWNGEIFHRKDKEVKEVYWYSLDMEQSFLIPGYTWHNRIVVNDNKLYYTDRRDHLIEFNAITGETRTLCDFNVDLFGVKMEYPYLYGTGVFVNVETGKVLASYGELKGVVCHGHGIAVVVKVTDITPVDGYNRVEYVTSVHDLSNFNELYVSEPRKTRSLINVIADLNKSGAIHNAGNQVKVNILSGNYVKIDNELIKVREKTTTKPKCKVCHKKLTKCGVVLPCKHCTFHYDCIGDIGSKCPQCDGNITDKINTA